MFVRPLSGRPSMTRNNKLALCLLALAVGFGGACTKAADGGSGPMSVSSPDGSLVLSLSLRSKPQPYLPGERIYYRVSFKGTPVLEDSPLGLDFTDGPALDREFNIVKVEKRSNDSTWENAF